MSEQDRSESGAEGGQNVPPSEPATGDGPAGPDEDGGRPDPCAPDRPEPHDNPARSDASAPPRQPRQFGSSADLSDSDVADRFADIVARWESARDDPAADSAEMSVTPETSEPPGMPEPVQPPDPGTDTTTGESGPPPGRHADSGRDEPDPNAAGPVAQLPATHPSPTVNQPLEGSGWRVHSPAPEPEEDFVPPPPRPLPHDPGFWAALFGLVAGPLWLLYLAVIHPSGSRLQIALSIALTVGGFAILVARLPRRGQRDDDDDGAVV